MKKEAEQVKYFVNAVITDPAKSEGTHESLMFNLEAEFVCNPDDYGNGYYTYIRGKGFSQLCYDLRYSMEFNRNKKADWLKAWANSYWSGKNGAWAVKYLDIQEA